MDDKKKLEDEIQELPKVGSGSLLAAARKEQKRTVEEIADELNLSVTQIRTIELDQSEGLPEPTYVRGYIRSYARLLGLNVDEVLEHYLNPNWQKGTRLDDMPRDIGSANEVQKTVFFTPGKIIFLIVILSVMAFLWFTGKLDGLLDNQTSTPVATITTPSLADASSLEMESPEQTANVATAEGQPSLADALSSEEQATDEAEEQVEYSLSLSFSDTSWVDIRDQEGNRLAYKSYAEGEDFTVTSATAMKVFIGNAKAVSAQFNGQPYDIFQYREGVFARFEVGQ